MSRRRTSELPDLFAGIDAGAAETVQPDSAIVSPFVEATREMLARRATTLGNMLSSERAVEYVAILRALAEFRAEHEPEPLHEEVELKVCGEDADAFASSAFKSDLRQLKEWGLVTERIEKERLRGYRDNRRTKFRYRLCEDAAAFVEWIAERHVHDLNPGGGDETGNLLDLQRSILSELRRMLHRVDAQDVSYEAAGDVLFRVDQVSRSIDATARTLQELNLRLLGFGIAEFSAEDAKPVVDELTVFLERFGRRFGTLREDILRDVEEMRRDCHAKRWTACAEKLSAEAARFRHIASVRVPDAPRILSDASLFYGAGGTLVSLMSRVGDSARKVWGKLNAKLRELERRNHRIEDLGARLKEFAALAEEEVPHRWMQQLLEPANMCGDAQIRPGGELSVAPRPKKESSVTKERIVTWITPRKVGERPDVASIAEERARRLKEWMAQRGIYPDEAGSVLLSSGRYEEFEDFANLMRVIGQIRLGDGKKAERLLNLVGIPTGRWTKVGSETRSLAFENIEMKRNLFAENPMKRTE